MKVPTITSADDTMFSSVVYYPLFFEKLSDFFIKTRNSARPTDQGGSYAFSFSQFTTHVCHLLPTSDIKHAL